MLTPASSRSGFVFRLGFLAVYARLSSRRLPYIPPPKRPDTLWFVGLLRLDPEATSVCTAVVSRSPSRRGYARHGRAIKVVHVSDWSPACSALSSSTPCWEVAPRRRAVPGTCGSFFLPQSHATFFFLAKNLARGFHLQVSTLVVAVSWLESTPLTQAALGLSLVERRVLDFSAVVESGLVHWWLQLRWPAAPSHRAENSSSTGKSKRGQRKGAEKKA